MEWKIFSMEWEENCLIGISKSRLPFQAYRGREASHSKLTQGATLNRNSTSLS